MRHCGVTRLITFAKVWVRKGFCASRVFSRSQTWLVLFVLAKRCLVCIALCASFAQVRIAVWTVWRFCVYCCCVWIAQVRFAMLTVWRLVCFCVCEMHQVQIAVLTVWSFILYCCCVQIWSSQYCYINCGVWCAFCVWGFRQHKSLCELGWCVAHAEDAKSFAVLTTSDCVSFWVCGGLASTLVCEEAEFVCAKSAKSFSLY